MEPGSKQERREQENETCIGGMRDPRKAVAQSQSWQSWGTGASKVISEALAKHPDFVSMVGKLGAEMSPEDAAAAGEALTKVGCTVAQLLAKQMNKEGAEKIKGPTGWRWKLIEEITTSVKDRDVDVSEWLKGNTPLGIHRAIQSRGIFPPTDLTKAQQESAEFLAARGEDREISRNYGSFHDNEQESRQELKRLLQEGHLEEVGPWDQVIRRWPTARATKIATLIKARPDGTNKVRFIVDMLRSGINGLAKAGERIVLPRGVDLVKDVLDLKTGQGELEFLTADFSDAFLNLSIEEVERGNAVILLGEDRYAAYRGVPFGLATAPLLWGRVAAWIGRASQAIHCQWKHRLQIYVDDPILVVKGNAHQRVWLMAQTLALRAGLGAKIALHKVSKGQCVKWIGANYRILPKGVEVSIDQERIAKLTEVVNGALQSKGLLKEARSLAGELSWVAGIVPTTRPFVNMIWGAIYGMETHNLATRQGESKGRPRPDGSVLVKMLDLPLRWFRKFLQGEHGGLRRVRLVSDQTVRPQWFLRTDAFTTGGGGILLDAGGTPRRWWAAQFSPSMLNRVGVEAGIPARMTVYELFTLLLSIKLWSHYLKKKKKVSDWSRGPVRQRIGFAGGRQTCFTRQSYQPPGRRTGSDIGAMGAGCPYRATLAERDQHRGRCAVTIARRI